MDHTKEERLAEMFGKNDVAKSRQDADTLLVHSVFYTLQGEGPNAGVPSLFVRLAGCNLRCTFCDTDFSVREEISHGDLFDRIKTLWMRHDFQRVVITGGEPLLQNLTPLLSRIVSLGIYFEIESAGTVWLEGLESYLTFRDARHLTSNLLIVSPKTPSINERCFKHAAAFKYLIKAGCVGMSDGLPVLNTQVADGKPLPLAGPSDNAEVFVQPLDELDMARNQQNAVAAAEIAMRFGYRLSLQMHKIVGVE